MSDLHRFCRQLVESLGAHEPAALGEPVAVDEIISRVLPYRACRRLFGILNVEDYELLLLRLVAGEGGLASGAPPAAVERCRAELETGHPDPGILAELGSVTIRLHLGAIALDDLELDDDEGVIVRSYSLHDEEPPPEPAAPPAAPTPQEGEPIPEARVESDPELADVAEAVEAPLEPPDGESVEFDFVATAADLVEDAPDLSQPAPTDDLPDPGDDPFQALFDEPGDDAEREPVDEGKSVTAPSFPEPPEAGPPASVTPLDSAPQDESPPPRPVSPPPPVAHGEPPPRCPHCASRLPSGRPVRFCPHCGSNVVPLQCASCGADLEPAWRHCVLCGAPAVNDSRFA